MEEGELRTTLIRLDCNLHITQVLLQELIAVLPQADQVLARFQRSMQGMARDASKDTDPEYLVELQARASQTLLALEKLRKGATS